MKDDIRKQGNHIIWQLSPGARKVWVLDPKDMQTVMEYRHDLFEKSFEGYEWFANPAEGWSNPAYGSAWGMLSECPEVPEATRWV